MLYFYLQSVQDVSGRDDSARRSDPVRLWTTLASAERAAKPSERVVVIDGFKLKRHGVEFLENNGQSVLVSELPRAAMANIDPYRPPEPSEAAGGYVVRQKSSGESEVLLIYRRQVWDLPKGRVEESETAEEAAVREVKEEVGIDDLRLGDPLGTTLHGFDAEGSYIAKTTFWYRMFTSDRRFTPEHEEDIRKVRWVPWGQVRSWLGYQSLKEHVDRCDHLVAGRSRG